jgi:cysteine-rich repeat protein
MTRHRVVLVALLAMLAAAIVSCGGSGSTAPLSACGNGRLDQGELCDDGNTNDTDACTSACKPARCGDGAVQFGVEDCDSFNMNGASCSSLGLSGDALRCTASCRFDMSDCGPAFTPTVAESPTPSPTPTPNPCGNGVLDAGEVCACPTPPDPCTGFVCPADCQVLPCNDPGTPMQQFAVDLRAPLSSNPTSVRITVGYKSDRVHLPNGLAAGARVKNRPQGSAQIVNNLGYAVTVVLTGTALPNDQVFTIDFDTCAGAEPVMAMEFGCTVDSCGSSNGTIDGCTCNVTPSSP